MAKPYKISPYHDLLEKGYPWVEGLRSVVASGIDDIMAKMKAEAEYEGQPELLNEDFLYERFKENCEHGLRFANWQVLKYFSRILNVKVWKETMGVWSYTNNDLEMFNYFKSMKVDKDTCCAPRYLNFKTCDYVYTDVGSRKPLISIYLDRKYDFKFIYHDNYGTTREKDHYIAMFLRNLYAIDNMLGHVRNTLNYENNEFKVGDILKVWNIPYDKLDVCEYTRRHS